MTIFLVIASKTTNSKDSVVEINKKTKALRHTTQISAKLILTASLDEVGEILVNLLNEEGGAASGLSQVHGEVTAGVRGRGRGCQAPFSYAAGNALSLRDATSPGFAKFALPVPRPKLQTNGQTV